MSTGLAAKMTVYFDILIGDKLVQKARGVDAENMDDAIEEIKGVFKNKLVCNFSDQCPKKIVLIKTKNKAT